MKHTELAKATKLYSPLRRTKSSRTCLRMRRSGSSTRIVSAPRSAAGSTAARRRAVHVITMRASPRGGRTAAWRADRYAMYAKVAPKTTRMPMSMDCTYT